MASSRLPGRGLLVVGGQITPVQTAIAESGAPLTDADTLVYAHH
jgi:hypothetical protein